MTLVPRPRHRDRNRLALHEEHQRRVRSYCWTHPSVYRSAQATLRFSRLRFFSSMLAKSTTFFAKPTARRKRIT